jgi:hypothetical protein
VIERCVAASSVPAAMTPEELALKLHHLRQVLDGVGRRGVLLVQEGALRWLTGMRHQVIDIAPAAPSPVSALVVPRRDAVHLSFAAASTELPRLRDRLPEVFAAAPDVQLDIGERLPSPPGGCLLPEDPGYDDSVGMVVRPLLGGLEGNPFRKLAWLHAETHAALAEAAHGIEPGMDGEEVQAFVRGRLSRRRIESNLVLVAVGGQEGHLHPLYDRTFRIEPDCMAKLVVGARFAELIVSASVMVGFGRSPDERQLLAYRALQQGAIEYADCYRAGAVEAELYEEIGRRFARIEKKLGLPGFADSAYAHHLGGPTSPLGNRDYLIEEGGLRTVFPWMQFAVNPVEVLFNAKVELQGLVLPEGPPLILDGSARVEAERLGFSRLTGSGGTSGLVADVIRRS